jgi:PAS domain-containing protein
VGLPVAEIFTPEDRAAGVPAEELATATREGSANDDRWMMRKEGARFWATGITTALRAADGGLLGFTKVLRDHTAEKRLDEERRTSEHRLLTALAAASMGTWEWEIATNLERFDEGLARLFGTESREITT